MKVNINITIDIDPQGPVARIQPDFVQSQRSHVPVNESVGK